MESSLKFEGLLHQLQYETDLYRSIGRQVGLFRCHTNIQKIYLQLKKSMATGITQKSCTALLPLWSLRKNDISKIKKNI